MRDAEKSRPELIEELKALRKRLARMKRLSGARSVEHGGRAASGHSVGLYKTMSGLRPNDHVCLIYESPDDWHKTIIPFIMIGLDRGEKCIYVLDSRTPDEIRSLLHGEQPHLTNAELSRRLVLLEQASVRSPQPSSDADHMLNLLINEAKRAITEGYCAIRMTEEMGAKHEDSADGLLEYEAKLNRDFFPKYPCVAICQYDRWRCHPRAIKNAIMTHPLILRNNQIHKNFYYVPPEEFLDQKQEEREVEEMLSSVENEGEGQKRMRFLSDVLERSTQAFAACYPDGRIMICNPAFCALTGRSEEELRRMTWSTDLSDPAWRALEARVIAQVCRNQCPQRYEKELVRNDGSLVRTEVFIQGSRDAADSMQYYCIFATDMTDRGSTRTV